MYLRFFGLRELPFELTPDPKFLYLTPRHREALSTLHYGVSAGKSLTVLLGEAGTGKTTLLRTVLESSEHGHVRWVSINNPILTREDFVRTLALRFELREAAARSKSTFLDEAQSLSNELLEEIRLLANIETAADKLLLLVLAGQPEFAAKLNDPRLRQLKQRVALRCEIAPFDVAETGAYIASRIATAGGESARLFTREAVIAIHECAHGIPRTINVICDNALLGAFAIGRSLVDRGIVMDVVADFDLKAEPVAVVPVAETAEVPPNRPAPVVEAAGAERETPSRGLFEQVSNPG